MNKISATYSEAMDFWNKAFTLSDEDKEKHNKNITADSDPADLAISKSLAEFVRSTDNDNRLTRRVLRQP